MDDGSPDGCPAICDEYAARDGRFRVIHKPRNEGLPAARKTGLDAASGEFVTHLDSDDWLEPRALEALYAQQHETDVDVTLGGYRELNNLRSENYVYKNIAFNDTGREGEYLSSLFLAGKFYLWGTLYRKSLFNGYEVPVENIWEDVVVNVQIFHKLQQGKLAYINDIVYNYDRRTNGVLKRQRYKTLTESPYGKVIARINNYIAQNNLPAEVADAANCFYCEAFVSLLRYYARASRNEINALYDNYWRKYKAQNRIKAHNRVIIPLYHCSILLGRLYIALLNTIVNLRELARALNARTKK